MKKIFQRWFFTCLVFLINKSWSAILSFHLIRNFSNFLLTFNHTATYRYLDSAEFLWQEGHTAHATADDAVTTTKEILDLYASVCEVRWNGMRCAHCWNSPLIMNSVCSILNSFSSIYGSFLLLLFIFPFFLTSSALSSTFFLALFHALSVFYLLPSYQSPFLFFFSSLLLVFFSSMTSGHVSYAYSERKKVSIWTIRRRWWHLHHRGSDAEWVGSAIRY